jgi:hypothetical protein
VFFCLRHQGDARHRGLKARVPSSSSRLECCSTPRSSRPERCSPPRSRSSLSRHRCSSYRSRSQRSSCARDPGRQSSSFAQVPRLQQGHVLICLC